MLSVESLEPRLTPSAADVRELLPPPTVVPQGPGLSAPPPAARLLGADVPRPPQVVVLPARELLPPPTILDCMEE